MKQRALEVREKAWTEWQDASLHYELHSVGLGTRFDEAVLHALEHLQ